MKAIADICVIPISGQISVREPVARAHQILKDAGLTVHLHAYGTNVEGELAVGEEDDRRRIRLGGDRLAGAFVGLGPLLGALADQARRVLALGSALGELVGMSDRLLLPELGRLEGADVALAVESRSCATGDDGDQAESDEARRGTTLDRRSVDEEEGGEATMIATATKKTTVFVFDSHSMMRLKK